MFYCGFVLFWNCILFIVFYNIVNCYINYLFLCLTGIACVWNYNFILRISEGKQFNIFIFN